MKHEWRKKEKQFYLPKNKPECVTIPAFHFYTIEGEGNPNSEKFSEYIQVLYALSYAVKMSPKRGNAPRGFYDYTVYPLEGVWDITEEAKKNFDPDAKINKDDLVFKLMIRQPDFVTAAYAEETIEQVKKRKPHQLLNKVKFERYEEGFCVQMLHIGSYDDEDKSFKVMEDFTGENGLFRVSKKHREIYLSDFRRVAPGKLKTVLRFHVSRSQKPD